MKYQLNKNFKREREREKIFNYTIFYCKKSFFAFTKINVYHSLINHLHYRTIISWITNEIGSRTSWCIINRITSTLEGYLVSLDRTSTMFNYDRY